MLARLGRPLPIALPAAHRGSRTAVRRSVCKAMASEAQSWAVATVTSTAPVVSLATGSNIELTVLSKESDTHSIPVVINGGFDQFVNADHGWARRGLVGLPDDLGTPGAVLVRKLDTKPDDEIDTVDYIKSVKLATQEGVFTFPANSWVSSRHGQRIFFEGDAYLPKDTPPALATLRKDALEALRTTNGPSPKPVWDRAYSYQVYDDLGSKDQPRPALGGSTVLPYPRHLANNLPEGTTKGPGTPWLPADEQFDSSKQQGFNGSLLKSVGPAVVQGIKGSLQSLPTRWTSFNDVLRLFRRKDASGSAAGGLESVWDLELDDDAVRGLDQKVDHGQLGPLGKLQTNLTEAWSKLRRGPKLADLFKFESPRVLADRPGVWDSDEEWGRQLLAGMNPCTLTVLKQLPSTLGSNIKPEHVDAELKALGGVALEQLVADAAAGKKPRIFIQDYWVLDTFWRDAVDNKRVEHAGRALFFLQQAADGSEEAMVPLVIELKSKAPDTVDAKGGAVYSRQALAHDPKLQNVWRLAKAVFRSLDSGFHQLVSHWLRCHACMEPFEIALRRQISPMHPVFKLMVPHFRYTLDINSKARASLIPASGIIEECFSPGPYAMRLSAAAYKGWRFRLQALPDDLKARGFIDSEGKILLQDYPYAQDGLEIWRELETYFGEYLRLYYKLDADVAGDVELQAWWAEAKSEGHPDMKLLGLDEAEVWGFAGPIPNIDTLVRVLTTIAWTTSAHHAAVNFGQYDFSSLLLNVSALIRRPIPHPDDTASDAYKALLGSTGKAAEVEFLTYLADPVSTLKVMVTVQLLSIHADDEQTLNERNTLLTDPAAVATNTRFMNRMEALEAKFQSRNRSLSAWTRSVEHEPAALPYELLIPPSPAGLTGKGVPYSVSI